MATRRETEGILQELGRAQQGVAARMDLIERGLSVHAVDRLVRVQRVTSVQRGVYQLGPLPVPRAAERAALLACPANARLSHRTAALLIRIVDDDTRKQPVEVMMPRGRRPRLRSVRVHSVRDLRDDEVTELYGLPVTTPARTLLDIAESCPAREVEQAYATALRRKLVTREDMRAMVDRHPKHHGAPLWRKLLAQPDDPAFARSKAEEKLLDIVRRAKLSRPEMNVKVLGYEIDFLWRGERVIVEVDGYVFHSSGRSFVEDRRRDAELTAAGYRVLRFTWSDLRDDRLKTVVRLAQALAR
jgi:very-short-patch-repair endonuclease